MVQKPRLWGRFLYRFRLSKAKDRLSKYEGGRCKFFIHKYSLGRCIRNPAPGRMRYAYNYNLILSTLHLKDKGETRMLSILPHSLSLKKNSRDTVPLIVLSQCSATVNIRTQLNFHARILHFAKSNIV